MELLLIAGGFVALLIGGESLVSGAVTVAQRLRVPPMVIGLTLVGFGTSMPELVTSLQAALRGSPGVAVGNVVGSNIANILLILGLSALLWPVAVDRIRFRKDAAFLLGTTVLSMALMATGMLSLWSGLILLAGLGLFLAVTLRQPNGTADALPDMPDTADMSKPLWRSLLIFTAGLGLTLLGARWLVDGAIGIAANMGVSESLIGLTIVAVGTSLPELVTSVIAARRQQSEVALGNILGSNVFNLLAILGITATVTPITIPSAILNFDLWIMLLATIAMIAVAATGKGVSRLKGAILLAGYIAYIGYLILQI